MIDAIHSFLSELQSLSGTATERLERLAATLDNLLVAYHQAPDSEVEENEYPDLRQLSANPFTEHASQKFPEFGYYAFVAPQAAFQQEITIPDAIDDLIDITTDLTEVVWRWENTSERDAVWHFRFSFQTHWGRHLFNLRSYIHMKLFNN